VKEEKNRMTVKVRPSLPVWAAKTLGALLVALGLIMLGNLAWQLWGTGIAAAHAQQRLNRQFHAEVAHSSPTVSTPSATQATGPDVLPARDDTYPSLPIGTAIAHLVIPEIGVNDYVVEGVGSAQLAEGPGHYPGTAPIGGNGNAAIAGHRTTYGAPFYSLNDLHAGDLIYLTTTNGRSYTYRVITQFVVAPTDSAVLAPTPTPVLTLTTCNPRFSATQRLIVQATLQATN
jgi:sortase A